MSRDELLNSDASQVSVKDLLMSLVNESTETKQNEPSHSLADALEKWEEYLKREDKSAKTVENYLSGVGNFVDWTTVESVEEVTQSEIIDYRSYMQNRGVKPASVNTILTTINLFFDFCVERSYISVNPAKKVRKVKTETLKPRSLDVSTVTRIRNFVKLSCDKRNDDNHLLIFDFMLYTGLRISEVLKLRFCDIDIDDVRVDVKASKGNKYRKVYMPDALVESYTQFKANLHRSKNESQFIFMQHGKPFKHNTVRTFYYRICRDHNIKHVSPHSLRHTYAVELLNKGVPMTHLQKLLGHTNFNTTARYLNPSDEDLKASVNL